MSNQSPQPEQKTAIPYPSCQAASAPPAESQVIGQPLTPAAPQPKRWRPTTTWVLLGINIAVWVIDALIGLVLGTLMRQPFPSVLLSLGAKHNQYILQGQIWRLFTPIFLHVGVIHLAFNSYAIYMIGPQIECFFGHWRFLSIYLLSGFYGVLFSFALSSMPSAGASGAIFGLIGTQAAFFYRYRNEFGQRGRRQLYSTLSVIAFNLVLTFTAPSIDIWGHVGGLVAGAILGWNLTPRYTLVRTETGATLVDRNHVRRWGMIVLGAAAVLVLSTWLTITVQASVH
jgi:rhomboid protease GluP